MIRNEVLDVILKYVDKDELFLVEKLYITFKKPFFYFLFKNKNSFHRYYLNIKYKDGMLLYVKISRKEKDILKNEIHLFNIGVYNKSQINS